MSKYDPLQIEVEAVINSKDKEEVINSSSRDTLPSTPMNISDLNADFPQNCKLNVPLSKLACPFSDPEVFSSTSQIKEIEAKEMGKILNDLNLATFSKLNIIDNHKLSFNKEDKDKKKRKNCNGELCRKVSLGLIIACVCFMLCFLFLDLTFSGIH